VLAGVASALAATHAADAVHRDVKGDNILVRLEDGHPFLIDFGSGYYRGAPTLTWQVFPPGTQPYRAPEAWRFALHIREEPVKVYSPGPAQDVFALGVTAYKLVTGQYPPQAEPLDPQFHVWRTDGPGPRPARELNPHCCEELNALIHRMLSRQPEARGSAGELAGALEHAARVAGPEADVPLFAGEARQRVARVPAPPPSQPEEEDRRPSLTLAGILGFLLLGAGWVALREHVARLQDEAKDAGTVAVGDLVLTAPVASPHASFEESPLAQALPAEPFPGQIRTDARGRCPDPGMLPVNGGCWIKISKDPKECAESEYSYEYKGGCYMPAFRIRSRPATSSPPEARDGGG
jgi:serine/threonine-protein kinase